MGFLGYDVEVLELRNLPVFHKVINARIGHGKPSGLSIVLLAAVLCCHGVLGLAWMRPSFAPLQHSSNNLDKRKLVLNTVAAVIRASCVWQTFYIYKQSGSGPNVLVHGPNYMKGECEKLSSRY